MVFEKICAIISEQFDVEVSEISMETSFENDLNADSLDVVEMAMSVENEFDLPEIEEDAVKKIATVGDLVAYVTEVLSK